MIYIFWTCRDAEEAKRVARVLLEKRLIACASILPQAESLFRWEGKIEEAREAKVIMKTRKELFEQAAEVIRKLGSYETPEIVEVEAGRANPAYLDWLMKETR